MHELEKPMYYKAKPETIQAAKLLRENMTKCERILWERLKGKQIDGFRFRRQHPIDFFIADFYCHPARLVVEIDGGIHKKKKDYDEGRTTEMEKYGIKVIRFSNDQIITNLDYVIDIIKKTVTDRVKSPPWGI
jgi:very-short-patch-repair endonuclease